MYNAQWIIHTAHFNDAVKPLQSSNLAQLSFWDTPTTAATHMTLASSLERGISHYKDCGYHGSFKLVDHHLLNAKWIDAICVRTKRPTQTQPSWSATIKPGIRVSQRALKTVANELRQWFAQAETEPRWQGGVNGASACTAVSYLKPPYLQVHAKSMQG